MKRLLVTALIVVLAATSAWSWHSLRQERERSDRLQAEVAKLRQSPSPAPELPATVAPASRALPKRPSSEENGTGPRIGFVSSGGDPTPLKDADGVVANNEVFEALLATQYTGLAQLLDLPQAVVDQLIAIKAREFARRVNALPPNLAGASRESLELQRQQDRLEEDTEIAALIGESKLQKFREYESSLGERQHVKELRLELLDTPDPLTADKSERLIRALHQERLRLDEEMAAMMPPRPDDSHPIDQYVLGREYVAERQAEMERRLLKAAEAVLSPAQLKTYRGMLEVQSRLQKAAMESMGAQSDAMEQPPQGN